MSLPIKATPVLYGEDARKFLMKVEEGAHVLTGPLETPKAIIILDKILNDARISESKKPA